VFYREPVATAVNVEKRRPPCAWRDAIICAESSLLRVRPGVTGRCGQVAVILAEGGKPAGITVPSLWAGKTSALVIFRSLVHLSPARERRHYSKIRKPLMTCTTLEAAVFIAKFRK